MSELARRIAATARWLVRAYALDLELDPLNFVISPEDARCLLPPGSPRTGLIAVEADGELEVGLYVDPLDASDSGTVVEETSHLLCLAWHASRDRPVSALALEVQGEVDRFLFARACGRDPLAHFDHFRWAGWLLDSSRDRYHTAHRVAQRYCTRLERQHPRRRDTRALLSELRAFYRHSPQAKLRVAEA